MRSLTRLRRSSPPSRRLPSRAWPPRHPRRQARNRRAARRARRRRRARHPQRQPPARELAKPNRLAMGSLVQVRGTNVSVVGHSRKAKLRGVVVRRGRHSFALAGNGSVLAVASVSPPATGQVVSTTVQVTPTALSNDDGNCQVDQDQAPSAELRGTVLSQDATTLHLTVNGFPAGLTIALGTVRSRRSRSARRSRRA